MEQFPVQFVTLSSGERLAYRTAGSGPDVLLIHGNMSSSVHWQTTMAALSDSYRVIAPDLRGFGDSSFQARFDSLRELAVDVAQFCDAVGVDAYHVVGWSTGGGVALELAADRPDAVRGMVLLDSVPPTGYPMFAKDASGQPILTQPLTTKEQVASDPIQVLPVLNAYASGDRETMRGLWNALIYNLNQPPAEDYELYLDAMMKQRNLVDIDYALMMFNMSDAPSINAPGSGRLSLVTGPITVMNGEQDMVCPLAWATGTTMPLLGDRATLVTFPGSGHSPITDEPEACWAALRAAFSVG